MKLTSDAQAMVDFLDSECAASHGLVAAEAKFRWCADQVVLWPEFAESVELLVGDLGLEAATEFLSALLADGPLDTVQRLFDLDDAALEGIDYRDSPRLKAAVTGIPYDRYVAHQGPF